MEPAQAKVRMYLGVYEVIEILALGAIRVKLGPGTAVVIHMGDFPHLVKLGDRIPLYTEVPYAETISTPVQ
jgi:hypothetical protein